MSVKKQINNPLQKYIDEINSLDIFKNSNSKDLPIISEEAEKKIVRLNPKLGAKENLILLMKELKTKKKIS